MCIFKGIMDAELFITILQRMALFPYFFEIVRLCPALRVTLKYRLFNSVEFTLWKGKLGLCSKWRAFSHRCSPQKQPL